MTVTARIPIADRLAHEVPLAVGAALFRAHDQLRTVENLLELEAQDPAVAELYHRVKALRKDTAARLVDVAVASVEVDAR